MKASGMVVAAAIVVALGACDQSGNSDATVLTAPHSARVIQECADSDLYVMPEDSVINEPDSTNFTEIYHVGTVLGDSCVTTATAFGHKPIWPWPVSPFESPSAPFVVHEAPTNVTGYYNSNFVPPFGNYIGMAVGSGAVTGTTMVEPQP